MAPAAISSSRTALNAWPIREFSIRDMKKAIKIASSKAQTINASLPVDPMSLKFSPKTDGETRPGKPAGPPVISRLMAIYLNTSPHP
ncbi:hypothetical protein AXX12_10815 [Anaerosporomusa subterranea]|uniref:Uncharacterized protein n=1 Tax=Anaerosporomusa subterranea TaxID=1794912 RepID=A0A154BP31_ANASB|nr:hypothetical protein AXX12_10815 [Anaerosporomusa subterranea]